jgi:hypothetical protein
VLGEQSFQQVADTIRGFLELHACSRTWSTTWVAKTESRSLSG